jgi:AAA+ ATPase superfamily predicted ATPase
MKNNNDADFWDREEELGALRRWFARRPRLSVLHGRRRLGKTSLIRCWLREAPGCYVQATEGTPASQRSAMAEDLHAVLPGFGDVAYPSWRALLDAMKRRWPARSTVLVIDEFPYLVRSSTELPSLLQAMVDSPDAGRVPLFLCGSSQRMMQGLVLGPDTPLFGRAQLLLRLEPLPAMTIRAALGLEDAVAAVEAYAAFGGVPRYWELMHEGGHAAAPEALEHLVFSPMGVLHEEADRVLHDEETGTLERALCELIGRGARRPSELAGRLGVKETTLAKPLRHLADLGLVERQAPYDLESGRPAAGGRRAFYRLADPFMAMWYACARPNLSGLNLGATAALKRAGEAWVHHVAAMWEDLCRRQWHRLGFQNIEWEPAGRYWAGRESAALEWDVVSVSSDRRHVFLGECKWMRDATRKKVDAAVRAVVSRPLPPLPPRARVHLGLFLPSARAGLRTGDVALFDAGRVLGV